MGLPGRLAVQCVQGVPVPVGAVRQAPGAEGEPPGEGRALQGLDLRGGGMCVGGGTSQGEGRRGLKL